MNYCAMSGALSLGLGECFLGFAFKFLGFLLGFAFKFLGFLLGFAFKLLGFFLGFAFKFLGFAFKPNAVPFEKAAHAFKVLSPALLRGTFQHGQSKGDCDYPCQEAGVSQKT